MNGGYKGKVLSVSEIEALDDPKERVFAHLKRLGFKAVDVRKEAKPTILVDVCPNREGNVTLKCKRQDWKGDVHGLAYYLSQLADNAAGWAIWCVLNDDQ